MTVSHAFLDALPFAERTLEIADADDIFGWLIGSWDIDAILYNAEGCAEKRTGEVHASWILEGRAIQDLFIFPRRSERTGIALPDDRYATTVRTYDKKRNVWHVNFINPAADETSARLIARREGNKILMEGNLSDNTPIRWRYESFSSTSFHYIAEKLGNNNKSWRVYLELFGKRV